MDEFDMMMEDRLSGSSGFEIDHSDDWDADEYDFMFADELVTEEEGF